MGFHENKQYENWGDSNIRSADGVDIIEAESNPNHGQYIGDLEKVSQIKLKSNPLFITSFVGRFLVFFFTAVSPPVRQACRGYRAAVKAVDFHLPSLRLPLGNGVVKVCKHVPYACNDV